MVEDLAGPVGEIEEIALNAARGGDEKVVDFSRLTLSMAVYIQGKNANAEGHQGEKSVFSLVWHGAKFV